MVLSNGRSALRLSRFRVCGIALALLPVVSWGDGPKPAGVKPGDPAITLAAEKYGYLPLPKQYLAAGLSMFTLHFVDETHLLFTFHTRGLMERLADSAPDDDDRRITAVLIELPTGKEVARTVWRTRDQDQYLWPLTHGRFLLRIRSKLTVIDPVRKLGEGNAFAEQSFLDFKRRIGYIEISPGGELLTVETLPPRAQEANAATAMDAGPAREAGEDTSARSVVETRFFRLLEEGSAGKPEKLVPSAAGGIVTRSLIHVPATSEGFIDTTRDGSNGFLFDFQSHAGKRMELAGYETTCPPKTYMVSRSEFVAFGCQIQDKSLLSEFDLRGKQPWVLVLNGQYISPMVTAAPAAGRFVLSRIMVGGSYLDISNLSPDEMTAQELTVMQNHDGRVLLKTKATPIERVGQNFDLSEDGMSFVTIQTTQSTRGEEIIQKAQILVYQLGALTAADQKEVKLEEEAAPPRTEAMVRLVSSAGPKKQEADAAAVTVQTGAKTVTTVEETAGPAPKATLGDVHPEDGQQKPPTLYDPDHPPENPKKPPPEQ
jgi:hypothetical protein